PGGPQVFCRDSQELCTRAGSICLVFPRFEGFGGDRVLGTYYRVMAAHLARHGWKVHVLLCGGNAIATAQDPWAGRLAGTGISVAILESFDCPAALHVPGLNDSPVLTMSERVLFALSQLHQQHHFDLVEFPDRRALGFRAIQARRAGVALHDLRM